MSPKQGTDIAQPTAAHECPLCKKPMITRFGGGKKATRWSDSNLRCERCRVGISNARKDPTTIYGDPIFNIPEEVRTGVVETLAKALNRRNLENKWRKFGFSTSEDALTWAVFKYLHDTGQLLDVLRRAGLPIPEGVSRHETLLLWGVPIPIDRAVNGQGWRLRRHLESIADQLGEVPRSRTEPDVLIDLGLDGIVIIEVKHRSRTDVMAAGYGGWGRYYPAGSPLAYAASVRASGCYELARNWRFGLELAADPARPFMLACLGPAGLFRGKGDGVLRRFEAALPQGGPARFQRLTWEALLGAVGQPPGWLVGYVAARGYGMTGERR